MEKRMGRPRGEDDWKEEGRSVGRWVRAEEEEADLPALLTAVHRSPSLGDGLRWTAMEFTPAARESTLTFGAGVHFFAGLLGHRPVEFE